jgi:hypothetical protein
MKRERTAEGRVKKEGAVERLVGKEFPSPPRAFHHPELANTTESAEVVDAETLRNRLHHIHFGSGNVHVHLRHPRYEQSLLVGANPEPCLGGKLTCTWSEENLAGMGLEDYEFLHLVVDDGRSMILVPAVLQEINGKCFTVELPATSYAVGKRRARRYACNEVRVHLNQGGFLAKGNLLDFSPLGFRVRLTKVASGSFSWFNPDDLVQIQFHKDHHVVFSGPCRCIRQHSKEQQKDIVLVPIGERIQRFKKRKVRNPRQKLLPSPLLVFSHPLLNQRIQLNVSDISSSGLSVCESAADSVLIPGMIIPKLTIRFAGAFGIQCVAQVIYRSAEDSSVVYGISILDMDIESYKRLNHVLSSAQDPYACVSSEVDMDALWEFMFSTGFIYPKKYGLIQNRREEFKQTYCRLYQDCPEIAGHFTYQKNGRIYGHISMVRAYERTWMIHHHAARAVEGRRAGFTVLKQIMQYLNDLHRLPSAKIDYVISYFRPESKFPDRVFGGFATALDKPHSCSLDLFSYLPYPTSSLGTRLPEGWSLSEWSSMDRWHLERFYAHSSGGLLLNVLAPQNNTSEHEEDSLENLYRKYGLVRRWNAYSLKRKGKVTAVLIQNQSDPGLNLSELLNGIKILVLDSEKLPWDVLAIAIGKLALRYDGDKAPVLIYPFEYVEAKGIPYEKQYQMWILDVNHGNEYMEYMQNRFRIGRSE